MKLTPTGPLPDCLGADEVAILFDAECVVCNSWVHFVLKWDRDGVLRIGAVQSEAGRALLAYAGLDTDDVDTMLLVERGVPYAKSSAVVRASRYFRFPMVVLSAGIIFPRFLRDWFYDRIALNRYSLFGRKEMCLIPAPEERVRFLDG